MQESEFSSVDLLNEKNCQQIAALCLKVLNLKDEEEKMMDAIANHIGYYAFKRGKVPWFSLFRAITEGNMLRINACAETDKEKQYFLWKESEKNRDVDSLEIYTPLKKQNSINYSRFDELIGLTCQEVAAKYLKVAKEQVKNLRIIKVITGHVGYCAINENDPTWRTLYNSLVSGEINRLKTIIRAENRKELKVKSDIEKPKVNFPLKPPDFTQSKYLPKNEMITSPNNSLAITFSTPPLLTDEIDDFTTGGIQTGETKLFICLANSVKKGGSCLAGRELHEKKVGEWIRITHPQTDCLMDPLNKYENNESPRIFDIVKVDLLKPCPLGHQKENWEIQPNSRLRLEDRIKPQKSNIDKLLESTSSLPLWIDGSYTETNDRVLSSNIRNFNDSLRFIFLPSVELYKTINFKGNDAVRAKFKHRGCSYDLTVKDPLIFDKIFNTVQFRSKKFKPVQKFVGQMCREIAQNYLNTTDKRERQLLVQHIGYQTFEKGKLNWKMLFHGIICNDILRIHICAESDNRKKLLIRNAKERDKSKVISIGRCFATISLANNYKNSHYKLLAALIPVEN